MSRTCSIYGLGLQANVSIAGLKGLREPGRVDVSLTIGTLPPEAAGWCDFFVSGEQERGRAAIRVARSRDGAYHRIRYADETVVVLDSAGRALWAVGPSDASVEETATYLLGPVLGYLLRLRGITSLHASAVTLDGRAVAFVGPSEAGKSTTAAAFARRGHPVLADDVVPLVEDRSSFLVQPAYPRVRLWPDSARSLFGDDSLPRITPGWEKRYLDLNRDDMCFAQEPARLGAIYLLGERLEDEREARIDAVDARAALMAIVPETCAARLLDRDMRAREFELLSRLVQDVPVRRLRAPARLASMDATCAAIERDARFAFAGP